MTDAAVQIGDRVVGRENATYLIAEIGINHGGDVEEGKRLVAAAAKAGADAAKLQTYRTEQRVPADSEIFDVLKECELDEGAHAELARTATDEGIDMISTPFDLESVELLSRLGVPAYKIASFDIVNLALIQRVAAEHKPVIVSRGMATVEESDRAVEVVTSGGAKPILLHCISAYPLDPCDANLAVIGALRTRYGCPVGFSDHSLGSEVTALAVACGAAVIEKHFTLDRSAPGPDHAMSLPPEEFAELSARVRQVEEIVGSEQPRRLEAEAGTVPFRRPSEPR